MDEATSPALQTINFCAPCANLFNGKPKATVFRSVRSRLRLAVKRVLVAAIGRAKVLGLVAASTTTVIDRTVLSSLTVRERPGKSCFRFWQEGPGFDRNLFTAIAVEASIVYIHVNPVKRGLCQRAVDWKWSSARFYLDQRVDSSLPRLSRPPNCLPKVEFRSPIKRRNTGIASGTSGTLNHRPCHPAG